MFMTHISLCVNIILQGYEKQSGDALQNALGKAEHPP